MKNVIYKIRNVVNGKFYVGSTVDSRVRFQTHRRNLKKGKHQSPHMQAAWNKYGEDCFKFEVVEIIECSEDLLIAEQKWLDEHAGKPYCYNWATDASAPMRGKKHTEYSKNKVSENRKGKHGGENHYRFGKRLSAEIRKKISEAQKGVKKAPRVYTEEGLRKAQETMKRNARPQEHTPLNEVLAKFPEEVRSKYDFTNAIYTGALNRITGCVCPTHGEFSQYAAQFRKGSGCAECGALIRNEKKRIEMKMKWSTEEGRKKMGRGANKIVA
jgi:group I intron endonuclease